MEDRVRAPAATMADFLADIERRAYRFARYALWDRESALDAVQDSMCRLVERYAERSAAEWPALFFTILRNRTTDTKRWRAVQRLYGWPGGGPRDYTEHDRLWASLPGPAQELPEARQTANEQRRSLECALAELPARQRQVFLLREWQGLTTAETAQALRCSAGSVKQHHFRALQALRTKSPQEREAVREHQRRYRALPPEQQRSLRQQYFQRRR